MTGVATLRPDAVHGRAGPVPVRARPDPAVMIGRVVLAAATIYAALLLWGQRAYVPIWDGRVYADCAIAAALRCAGHPSHAYMGLLALAERLAPGQFAPLLGVNAALLALSAVAFGRVLRALAPGDAWAAERALAVSAFVVHPVVLASAVQPGLDFGAMACLLWVVASAVERRPWRMAAFGLLAAFSKESGVLVYALLAGAYVLTYALPRPMPRALRVAALAALLGVVATVSLVPAWPLGLVLGLAVGAAAFLVLRPRPLPDGWTADAIARRAAPLAMLALPVAAFVAYLAYRATLPRGAVLWMGESGGSVARSLLTPQLGPTARNYLALTFVLGFLWVPSLVLAADLAIGARRYAAHQPRRRAAGMEPDALAFLTLAAVGTVYLLTRYITFANARYLLPAYPLLLALLLPALDRLRVPVGARVAFLTGVVALLGWSAVRTADPVSRALWGTFPVGEHRLLRITSRTGECCGAGRDQLIYNLQFTALDRLTGRALAAVQPIARSRALATAPEADWYVIGPLDHASRRTLSPADADTPTVLHPDAAAAEPRGPSAPDSLWYLAMPNVDQSEALRVLARQYVAARPDTVRDGGYAMPVIRLVRRVGIDTAAAAPDVPMIRR